METELLHHVRTPSDDNKGREGRIERNFMIRHTAYALVFLLAFLFIVAEVQQLEELNQPMPLLGPT
jgi:hypothetical protein